MVVFKIQDAKIELIVASLSSSDMTQDVMHSSCAAMDSDVIYE
jgi:hypothetical protein